MLRKFSVIVLAFSMVLSVSRAAAEGEVNLNGGAFALGGYDVVAYFSEGKATRGSQQFAAAYQGATWLFATAEHKARFEKAPASYVPAYGGYCAYGAAKKKLVRVDPEAFTIRRGKLYLNYSLEVRSKWLRDVDGFIERADQYFSTLSH
jgi:YHS domain-containing protein